MHYLYNVNVTEVYTMNEKIKKFTEDHIEELKDDIKELCSIPSVLGDAEDGAPFGAVCRDALLRAGQICEKYGFPTTNYDNYCVAADFDTALPKHLDMLGHTDVVPAGEGWTVTEPFTVIEKDGRLSMLCVPSRNQESLLRKTSVLSLEAMRKQVLSISQSTMPGSRKPTILFHLTQNFL